MCVDEGEEDGGLRGERRRRRRISVHGDRTFFHYNHQPVAGSIPADEMVFGRISLVVAQLVERLTVELRGRGGGEGDARGRLSLSFRDSYQRFTPSHGLTV